MSDRLFAFPGDLNWLGDQMIPQRKLAPALVIAIGLGCMHLSIPNKRNPGFTNEPDQAITVI